VPRSGDFVLLYPKWLPGAHSPRGAINKVAGLKVSAGDRRLAWRRDPADVYAFHVDVPEGVKSIERRVPVSLGDRRRPGPDGDDSRAGEHPVDRQLALPGRLLRPRHPGAGDPDGAARLAGGDRASADESGGGTSTITYPRPYPTRSWSIRRLIAGAHYPQIPLSPT
jgi:hypothetical protein